MSTRTEISSDGPAVPVRTEEATYREAIRLALNDELSADANVVLLGEDVADAGGPFKTSEGLLEMYGVERIINTPIAENGFTGVALGMALAGLRPVVEIMFSDFLATAADAIAIEIPKWRFMSGGQCSVPVTIRASGGAGGRFGSQHSTTGESVFLQAAGLSIVTASSPHSAYGLLRTAIRHNNPVLFIEHKGLYSIKGSIDRGDENLPEIGKAEVVREGEDITIVSTLLTLQRALEAADQLSAHGVSVEVVDLRWVSPMDLETIQTSLITTGRLLVVEEQYHNGGWGSSLISRLTVAGYRWTTTPRALSMPDLPIPYSPQLEDAMVPGVDQIMRAVTDMIAT